MKKKACSIWLILLLSMLEGCAETGEDDEQLAVPKGQEREKDGLTKGDQEREEGSVESEEKGSAEFLFPRFNTEEINVKGEHHELLHVYLRNRNGSSLKISKECFEWYLDSEYMGMATEVYSGDCETVATEWGDNVVLCILLTNDKEFRVGSTVKLVQICHDYWEREFTINSRMFLKSKIFIL